MPLSLTQFAKAGFTDLSAARDLLEGLAGLVPMEAERVLELVSGAADPDRAITWLSRLFQSPSTPLQKVVSHEASLERLLRILGGSRGLAEFLERQPHALEMFLDEPALPGDQESVRATLCASV
ncbi:MAG: Glutamate-ammonia-ligase adenylyltransferase, partial [Actinomycetota bacterium]